MDKTEWPTEGRLADLRDKGIFSYSDLTTASAALAALLLSIYMLRESFLKLWLGFRSVIQNSRDSIDFKALSELGWPLLELTIIPLLSALVVSLLVGLFQTKFFVRPARVAFDLSRLKPFGERVQDKHHSPFLGFVRELGINMTALCIGALIFLALARDFAAFLNPNVKFIISTLGSVLEQLLAIACGVLIVSALVMWTINRLIFLLAHRMTKQEIESEARES